MILMLLLFFFVSLISVCVSLVQILANPFDDIIPRQVKKKDKEEKKAKSKSKATK